MITLTAPRIHIPEITNERLNELLLRIKPVVEFNGVKHWIKKCHPRDVAYTWDARKAGKAPALKELRAIRTYHTYGYHGMFKPSIAEVIAQIPADIIDQVTEFEIVKRPLTATDLNEESRALNAGFHVATTVLYGRA
jgi:hypothetical protein